MELTIDMSRDELNRSFDAISDAIDDKLDSIGDDVNRLHSLLNSSAAVFTASDILFKNDRVECSRVATDAETTACAIKRKAAEIAGMCALLCEINNALTHTYYPSENA